jgi:hypothetical protein
MHMRHAEGMSPESFRNHRRSFLLAVLKLALVLSVVPFVFGQSAQPPATIMLIRHAEKLTDGRMDLSPAGFERAKVLPMLFDGKHGLPRPDFIFATHVSKKSNRPVETVTPLSQAIKMEVHSDFEDDDYASLAKLLLSGQYAGKVVLVAWHHGTMPEFAEALGVQPKPARWPETQFDRVWRIDYRNGKAVLTDLPQALMAGDSK